MRPPSLPLILKLAAAAITGSAALLAIRRLHRDEALSSLRRDIHNALVLLVAGEDSGAEPPAILVAGFRSHGKSALVNTACRALASESGPLLLRAETAPPGPEPATVASHVIRAAVVRPGGGGAGEGGELAGEEERPAVDLVDAPPLPEPARLGRDDVAAALAPAVAPPPECVVVVLRCGAPPRDRSLAVRKLPEIAGAIRERGLNLVVVLTQKKALKTAKQAEELRREVAFRARTDSIYFIESYTAGNALDAQKAIATKNDFETQFTVLAVIRQCIEFAKMHRNRLAPRTSPVIAPPIK